MPRCLHCKEKFNAEHFNQKFCLKKDECISSFREWAKKQRAKMWRKEKRELKKDLETKPQLEKKLETEINTIVRLLDEGHQCISCGGNLGEKYDAGHFYSVSPNFEIRFHLFNIFAQCVQCNQHKGGNEFAYYQRLKEVFSEEYQDYIVSLKGRGPLKLSKPDLREAIVRARKVVRRLKKKNQVYSIQDRIELRFLIQQELKIYDY